MKYTEQEYNSKLLPESIARYIINWDMAADWTDELLKDLWKDDRQFLLDYANEKEFVLAVMTQKDKFVNQDDYKKDMEALVNEQESDSNALSDDDNWHGVYLNYQLTALHIAYKYVPVTLRQMLETMGFKRRSKFTLKAINTYFENFGRKGYIGLQPADIANCNLDDVMLLK